MAQEKRRLTDKFVDEKRLDMFYQQESIRREKLSLERQRREYEETIEKQRREYAEKERQIREEKNRDAFQTCIVAIEKIINEKTVARLGGLAGQRVIGDDEVFPVLKSELKQWMKELRTAHEDVVNHSGRRRRPLASNSNTPESSVIRSEEEFEDEEVEVEVEARKPPKKRGSAAANRPSSRSESKARKGRKRQRGEDSAVNSPPSSVRISDQIPNECCSILHISDESLADINIICDKCVKDKCTKKWCKCLKNGKGCISRCNCVKNKFCQNPLND